MYLRPKINRLDFEGHVVKVTAESYVKKFGTPKYHNYIRVKVRIRVRVKVASQLNI